MCCQLSWKDKFCVEVLAFAAYLFWETLFAISRPSEVLQLYDRWRSQKYRMPSLYLIQRSFPSSFSTHRYYGEGRVKTPKVEYGYKANIYKCLCKFFKCIVYVIQFEYFSRAFLKIDEKALFINISVSFLHVYRVIPSVQCWYILALLYECTYNQNKQSQ